VSTLEERALADSDDSDRFVWPRREFAGTQRDTLTSFIKISGELAAARAALGRVRALLGDDDGPLWAVRGVREADIRAALEPTQPKGKP